MLRILPHRALVEPRAAVTRIDAKDGCSTATLRIEGLVCSACAANVRGHIEQLDGVREAHVDLDTGEARVVYDASMTRPDAFMAAVERAVLFPKARRLLAALAHLPAGRASARHGQQRRSGSSDPDKTSTGNRVA